MILKYISVSELNFIESWQNGWFKIKNLSIFDKYMTLFWFMGPFIYLIERDPADIWLTLICIVFLIRCISTSQTAEEVPDGIYILFGMCCVVNVFFVERKRILYIYIHY